MNTDIFIVSIGRHFPYLDYALRSIRKFATGFHGVHICIPEQDMEALTHLPGWMGNNDGSWAIHTFREWPEKGMLHHMYFEMIAPEFCPQSDLILHMDSDCLFTEPVTPDAYMMNGKPVLLYADYNWLEKQQANLKMWQTAVRNALGWVPNFEFMRRHPAVHYHGVYAKAKECIEAHTGKSMADYILSCRNDFPQTFAEYPLLGEIAWRFFHHQYHWIDQQSEPWPHNPMRQAWSHRTPTEEDAKLWKELGL